MAYKKAIYDSRDPGHNSELETAHQTHHIGRIIVRLNSTQPRNIAPIDPRQRRVKQSVIPVHCGVRDVLSFCYRCITDDSRRLAQRVLEERVRGGQCPRKVNVLWEESMCAVGWVGGGGAVREKRWQEGFDAV